MSKLAFLLKPHEEMVLTVRRSLIPIAWKFFLFVLWVLLPFFFLFPLFSQGTIGAVVFFVILLSGSFFLARLYACWSKTILVLTDRRVVDIEQRGFFDCVVTETPYTQIDEVSYRIKGMWATIFRYGTLRFDLAGSAADIVFDDVNHPARIYDLVNDLRREEDGGREVGSKK